MEFKAFIIKYAEIGTKGKNRYVFEDILCKQLRIALKRVEGSFRVVKEYGRIYVKADSAYDYDEAVVAMQHVFGVVEICPVVILEDRSWDTIKETAIQYIKECYANTSFTFKVKTRRADKEYPMGSMEIDRELGAVLLEAFPKLRVDVHEPDELIQLEIRDCVYLYSIKIPGPGGLPVGTNGKAMLLLSGGIDSPVAGYMIAKRGVSLEATYFHAPPYTSERAKQKVVDLARLVSKYAGPVKLHVVNFTDIQLAIYEKCPHEELTIIMRRYMMKIAEELAKKSECQALVTGESIGQVASQTIYSLAVTNEVCTMPVFRPCIGMDKQEIVDISEKIDTFETSIQPFEDCCTIFVAKHPVTKPKLEKIQESERLLDDVIDGLMEQALASIETMTVR